MQVKTSQGLLDTCVTVLRHLIKLIDWIYWYVEVQNIA